MRRLTPAFQLMYCAFAVQHVLGFSLSGLQESALYEPFSVGKLLFHGSTEHALIDGQWRSLRKEWGKDPTAAAIFAELADVKEAKRKIALLKNVQAQ
jgi:hypothetical protein